MMNQILLLVFFAAPFMMASPMGLLPMTTADSATEEPTNYLDLLAAGSQLLDTIAVCACVCMLCTNPDK